MSDYDTIEVTTDGAVMTITLNRPDKLNAWTQQMSAEMGAAIEEANRDDAIGAIVITGAGRAFCAGADIEDVFAAQIDGEDTTGAGAGDRPRQVRDWVDFVRHAKPIIAAINGPAIGVGLTMVLPADVLLATDDAKLGLRFIKMGLVPELASSHLVAQRVGWGKASELCLTGAMISGAEAARVGLVEYSLPDHDALMAKAAEVAASIAENPSRQALWIKQLLTENASDGDLAAVQARELALLQECYVSPEHREAVSAFMEKRQPQFR
jgi:enoyl-CoA hydratase/carnithine racemase